jgi:hypothetical protein
MQLVYCVHISVYMHALGLTSIVKSIPAARGGSKNRLVCFVLKFVPLTSSSGGVDR